MNYEISLLTTIGITVMFALSLNLITGFCGQISLGHAAFLGWALTPRPCCAKPACRSG